MDNIIIITTNQFKSLFDPYQQWKTGKGFTVVLDTLEDLGVKATNKEAQKLKNIIYQKYSYLKHFYLILGGKEIPAFEEKVREGVTLPQDFNYALYEENKIFAFVARLPFSEQNEFERYLDLVMNNSECTLDNALLISGAKGYENRTNYIKGKMQPFCQIDTFPYTAFNIPELVRQMENKQIIQYFGHGNKPYWQFTPVDATMSAESCRFRYDSVAVIPPAHILAWSCLTAIFNFDATDSMAESFMKKGALSYWGCANVSERLFSDKASRLFSAIISRHRSKRRSIGMLYLEVLYQIWTTETNDKIKKQCYAYVFHGDPTLEIDIH